MSGKNSLICFSWATGHAIFSTSLKKTPGNYHLHTNRNYKQTEGFRMLPIGKDNLKDDMS